MGNKLVALAHLPRADLGLSLCARATLVAMAAQAKDTDDEPIYFGGWPWLAGAVLGRDILDNAAHLRMARAIRELRDAKLIDPIGQAAPGQRVAYRLLLKPGP